MAKIGFSVEGQTLGTISYGFEIPDADALRILTAHGEMFGPVYEVGPDPELGAESVPVARPRTPHEVAQLIAEGTISDLLDKTVRYERNKAIREAEAAIAPIVPTPVV